ncbi:MAG TPA: peptidase M61 [Burkholderiaceae bacterium]|nr:peptidase M61 [Burkholderiaceae bacterium]
MPCFRLARRPVWLAAFVLITGLNAPLHAQSQAPATPASATQSTPYPGTLRLAVDATDLDHKVFHVRQTLPVRPGPLTLYLPRWIPGQHAPNGEAARVAGLQFRANGARVNWQRDPLDTNTFRLEVPQGAKELEISFDTLTPLTRDAGRVVMTPEILGVQWYELVLYPAGYAARDITVEAQLRLPEGWKQASAFRPVTQKGSLVSYPAVTLETLIDSPVFAGINMRRIELDPAGAKRPVTLNLFADTPEQLQASEEQIEAHRSLVRQADRLFGARHYAHYDFLLSLSETYGGVGLEHHQSSENGVRPNYFKDWSKASGPRELLPHEYTHSWNGKFRRPRDLWTPHYNTPMQDSLLWLYEGQTQYWGRVLAARSGLVSPELAREGWARVAAWASQNSGRAWRNLQDTTNEPVIEQRAGEDPWRNWRRSYDYYDEAALVWLEADMLIRERSKGQRSLDDFARAFFGVEDGRVDPLLYDFDDIVRTLNGVQPYDWAKFLRDHLDSHGPDAPLAGLEHSGWKLGYNEQQSENQRASEEGGGRRGGQDFSYSIGVQIAREGQIQQVVWDGPAFRAGVAPMATLVAVNQRSYTPEVLKEAITRAKGSKDPIDLLVKEGDRYRTVRVDYHQGLRYPALQRVDGRADTLSAILSLR